MNHKWRELLININQLLIKPTKHQEIWKRTENGLELELPKNINTDIGFQLMFGYRENYLEEVLKYKKHCNNYETEVFNYNDLNKIYK